MATGKSALGALSAAPAKAFPRLPLKELLLSVTIVVIIIMSWTSLQLDSKSIRNTAPEREQRGSTPGLPPFTIGISLGPSYGTIAIKDDTEDHQWHEVKIYGTQEYLNTMERLSSRDSRHVSPPYRTLYDGIRDWPRQSLRRARKSLGLPSTADVGRLAAMIGDLVAELLATSANQNNGVILALPALGGGLYDEDACDALEYVGLYNLAGTHIMPANPRTITLAFAAHGYGVCEDWLHQEECSAQQLRLPFYDTLLVDFTREALLVNLMRLRTFSTDHYHDQSPVIVDFSLGSGHVPSHSDEIEGEEDQYWRQVRQSIRNVIQSSPNDNKVDIIIFTGESAGHLQLQDIAEQVAIEYGNTPIVHVDNALYGAARAAWSISCKAAQIQMTYPDKTYFSCPPL